MAQAGIHAMVGMAVRKWAPEKKSWLIFGLVLGNLFPDMDNLAVAIATLARLPTDGLHRTFTHSVFTVLLAYLIFLSVGTITRQQKWTNFGVGFAVGIALHILLDFVLWFNGVSVLWPLPLWVNFWEGIKPPAWFDLFMNPAELLMFALFFFTLRQWANRQKTDQNFIRWLNTWMVVELVLFAIYTPLAYTMTKGFLTLFGVGYLFSLFLAAGITIRMRNTLEKAY